MTISLETISVLLLIVINLIALYAIIKNNGAKDMETKKEIDALKEHVSDLEKKIAIAENCTTKNDKAIGEMKIDIEWIKKGVDDIKKLIEAKS